VHGDDDCLIDDRLFQARIRLLVKHLSPPVGAQASTDRMDMYICISKTDEVYLSVQPAEFSGAKILCNSLPAPCVSLCIFRQCHYAPLTVLDTGFEDKVE